MENLHKAIILKNHKISKEGKYPKERGKSPTRARAHKEQTQRAKTKSAHKHLFTETQAGNTGSIKS